MKKLYIALLTACTCLPALAGSFEWELINKSSGYSTQQVDAMVRSAIKSSDPGVPSLKKPWFIEIYVASGGVDNSEATPGFVMARKVKRADKETLTERCMRMAFGTYTKSDFAEAIQNTVKALIAHIDDPDDCR